MRRVVVIIPGDSHRGCKHRVSSLNTTHSLLICAYVAVHEHTMFKWDGRFMTAGGSTVRSRQQAIPFEFETTGGRLSATSLKRSPPACTVSSCHGRRSPGSDRGGPVLRRFQAPLSVSPHLQAPTVPFQKCPQHFYHFSVLFQSRIEKRPLLTICADQHTCINRHFRNYIWLARHDNRICFYNCSCAPSMPIVGGGARRNHLRPHIYGILCHNIRFLIL